jgi:hypothetical protein
MLYSSKIRQDVIIDDLTMCNCSRIHQICASGFAAFLSKKGNHGSKAAISGATFQGTTLSVKLAALAPLHVARNEA